MPKVTELPLAATLTGAEDMIMVQDGDAVRAPLSHVTDLAEAASQVHAEDAAASAAAATALTGPTYASTAAGLASTANGDFFAVNNDGIVTIYLNEGGTAVAQRDIVTAQALASTAHGKGASLVGLAAGGTVADAIKYLTPEMFTAAPNDYAKVLGCITVANALTRTGATSNIFHPGATVALSREYDFGDMVAPIPVHCNIVDLGARIVLPAGSALPAFTLGLSESEKLLEGANIHVPEISRAGGATPSGSAGVEFKNINRSRVFLERIEYCQIVHRVRPVGQGTVYNDIFCGKSSSATIIWDVVLETGVGAWMNGNTFYNGSYFVPGPRSVGGTFVRARGANGEYEPWGNTWRGFAFEGPGAVYLTDARNFVDNTFEPYLETGLAPVPCTVSGANISKAAHGLAVNDVVTFLASSMPGGMHDSVIYYVTSVTADTFQVSLDRGGSPITFSSAGSGVGYYPAMIALWDGTDGANTRNNHVLHKRGPAITPLEHRYLGVAYNNGEQSTTMRVADSFNPADLPYYRGRNGFDSAAITRVSFAAYPPAINPTTQPTLWTVGLSDQGVFFKSSGSVTGQLSSVGGIPAWQANNSGVTRLLAPVVRTLGGPLSLPDTVALEIASGTEVDVEVDFPGIAVGDAVGQIGWYQPLPANIGVTGVWVPSAGKITIRLRNFASSGTINMRARQFSAAGTVQYF